MNWISGAISARLCENAAETMEQAAIQIQGLKKSFHGRAVLTGIDLAIHSKQLTVLIDPSRCGKSMLLRFLNGLEVFDEEKITINGHELVRDAASRKGRAR